MLQIYNRANELRSSLKNLGAVGFVPTMGNLHAGHLSLIKESLKHHKNTVVSIYVNPTQFGENEDFKTYPRTLDKDVSSLESLEHQNKKLFIFAPFDDKEIYPSGKSVISACDYTSSSLFEGKLRPGHFDGMITVVKRLFEMINPQHAYFGKKDYQQLLLVKELVKKFELSTKIIGMPTTRDANGLPLSSRNSYLSAQEIHQALILPQTLQQLKKVYLKNKSLEDVQKSIQKIKERDGKFNYLAVTDACDLSRAHESTKKLILLGNYQVAETRIIDNLEIL